MAGTLSVSHIQGLATHSDPTSVTVKTGHKLKYTPEQISGGAGTIIQTGSINTGYGSGARLATTSTSFVTLPIGGTGQVGRNTEKQSSNVIKFLKKSNNSHIRLTVAIPVYASGTGDSGMGIRCYGYSADSTVNSGSAALVDLLPNGFAHGWGMHGYGDLTYGNAGTVTFTWCTDLNSNFIDQWKGYTGYANFYWEVKMWSSSDTGNFIDYSDSYPKYGMITWEEVLES